MFYPKPWMILGIAILGNCGFWLFWFNRVNASGLGRSTTKLVEKLFILLCFTIPLGIALAERQALSSWLFANGNRWWPAGAPLFNLYGAWCCASTIVLGAMWLESRRWLLPPKHLLKTSREHYRVHDLVDGGSTGDFMTAFLNSLPGNQITDLDVTKKELRLPRQVSGLDGFTIGHISDLHFTGQFREEHYQFVLDRLMELQPDFIAITGDVIDYDRCLHWIEPLLGQLSAPYGCGFVLGNHDCRLSDVSRVSNTLREIGHYDLGMANQVLALPSGTRIEISGNELPWLSRHLNGSCFEDSNGRPSDRVFRLGLSHSPDQLRWARAQRVDLMLAGHTHGGQVRFPGVGPLVSPSWHGSRYASGVFYLAPTLMHVSRGVAGTHPLRWWCPPEISLLTLRI